MPEINELFDKTVTEIERMLNTKTVVGEPITVKDSTLIPLINVGFGFGVGSGEGAQASDGTSQGGGTGGGGGVKPVALVVINDSGVTVEPIKSGTASVLEKVAETMGRATFNKGNGSED